MGPTRFKCQHFKPNMTVLSLPYPIQLPRTLKSKAFLILASTLQWWPPYTITHKQKWIRIFAIIHHLFKYRSHPFIALCPARFTGHTIAQFIKQKEKWVWRYGPLIEAVIAASVLWSLDQRKSPVLNPKTKPGEDLFSVPTVWATLFLCIQF